MENERLFAEKLRAESDQQWAQKLESLKHTSPHIFRYEPAKCPSATAKGVSNRLRFIALDRRVVTLPAAAHPAPPGLTIASSGDTAHGGQNVRKN